MATKTHQKPIGEKLDKRLAVAARAKIESGKSPTKMEAAALRRVERREEELLRWKHYEAIPKGAWNEMSGLQSVQIHRHADQFGIPLRGRTIDLRAVVRWLHQFLAETAPALGSDGELIAGPKTESLERLRKAQAVKIEMQNRATRGRLMPADDVHRCFGLIAGEFRQASRELRAEFGEDAHEIMVSAVKRGDDRLAKLEKAAVGPGADNEPEAVAKP